MTERVAKLRQLSLDTKPWLSIERARLLTRFYNRRNGPLSVPLMRANALAYIMEHCTIAIGPGQRIDGKEQLSVGESEDLVARGTPGLAVVCRIRLTRCNNDKAASRPKL